MLFEMGFDYIGRLFLRVHRLNIGKALRSEECNVLVDMTFQVPNAKDLALFGNNSGYAPLANWHRVMMDKKSTTNQHCVCSSRKFIYTLSHRTRFQISTDFGSSIAQAPKPG